MAAGHKYGTTSRRRLGECVDELETLADALLLESPWDLAITCGFRNAVDQARALATGASNAGPGQSPHNRWPSYAFDFAILKNGEAVWDRESYRVVGELAERIAARLGIGITCGFRFKGFDGPHIEKNGWRDVAPSTRR